jgi:LPXTG-motif cell wall-anchored protein
MEVKHSMKHLGFFQTAACAALLFAAFSPRAVRADDWNQRTVMTFSDDVQVPGATLPAGTYVFRLRDSQSDRCTVQILNERENHMYATVLAIPDYHDTASSKTLVSFYEAPAGQPMPIKAWFYPGDKYGREFVYRKNEAALIAAAAKQTVPSEETYGTVASSETPASQPAVAEQPAPEQPAPAPVTPAPVAQEQTTTEQTTKEVTEPQPAPVTQSTEVTIDSSVTAEPAPQPSTDQTTDQTTDQPATLPSTGSEWPLAGLIGLSSLAGALGLRAARRLS